MWRRVSRRCAPAGAMFRREAYRLEAMSWQPHVGVVDPHRPLAYRLQWAVPRSCPVRAARHGVVAGSEEQAVGRGEVVLVDPLAQHRASTGRMGTLHGPVLGSPGSSKEMSATGPTRRTQGSDHRPQVARSRGAGVERGVSRPPSRLDERGEEDCQFVGGLGVPGFH